MPNGPTLMLTETEQMHHARCTFCANPSATLPWSITIAASGRRAVSVRTEDLRRLTGNPQASGELVVSGIRTKRHRWRSAQPESILETPDLSFSQQSIHDRFALEGALRSSCAPAWHSLKGGAIRARRDDDGQSILVLGPPEEMFGTVSCEYCDIYRRGVMSPRPFIRSDTASAKRARITRVRDSDVERLLMKPGASVALGTESAPAIMVHDLRDVLHALGITDPAPGTSRLRHWSRGDGEFTYIYPITPGAR